MLQTLVLDVCPPAAATVVSGITGLVVAVSVGSPGVVVGAAKNVVTVKAEAAPVAPTWTGGTPRAGDVVRSAERSGITVGVAMNDRSTV